jgi:hypothetical protein
VKGKQNSAEGKLGLWLRYDMQTKQSRYRVQDARLSTVLTSLVVGLIVLAVRDDPVPRALR